MKFTLVTYIALSAGVMNASAAPLRLLLLGPPPSTTNNAGVATTPRFGHAIAGSDSASINLITHERMISTTSAKKPCHGRGRFSHKAVQISNAFRQALGLPLIVEDHHGHTGGTHHMNHPLPNGGGKITILPFIGTPPTVIETNNETGEIKTKGGDLVHIMSNPAGPFRGNGPHRHHHLHHGESFTSRLHYALMSLGPWEGRAIAFVLGCGLGVLLRMIWVLTVVSYRTIKGDTADENTEDTEVEYRHILLDNAEDAEVIFVAPPAYPVEKTAEVDAASKGN